MKQYPWSKCASCSILPLFSCTHLPVLVHGAAKWKTPLIREIITILALRQNCHNDNRIRWNHIVTPVSLKAQIGAHLSRVQTGMCYSSASAAAVARDDTSCTREPKPPHLVSLSLSLTLTQTLTLILALTLSWPTLTLTITLSGTLILTLTLTL